MFSGRIKLHGSDGVFHWHTKAVSEKVGGTHLIHELLVNIPAACLSKLLGFDQNMLGGNRQQESQQS
jgi:hypothetical protein